MKFIDSCLLRVEKLCEKTALTAKLYALCKKNSELIRYIFCGGLTTFFNLAVYYVASRFVFGKLISGDVSVDIPLFDGDSLVAILSNTVAWLLAVAFAFFVNKTFVFKDNTTGGSLIWRLIEFYLFRLATGVLEIFLPSILMVSLHMHDMVAKISVAVIIILGNYFFTKFITFGKKRKSKNMN